MPRDLQPSARKFTRPTTARRKPLRVSPQFRATKFSTEDIELRVLTCRANHCKTPLDLAETNACDADIAALVQLVGSQLRAVELHNCGQITDAGIAALTSACPQFVSINVALCKKLSDTSIESIAANCPRLKTLIAWGCERITAAAFDSLTLLSDSLESLDVGRCERISDLALHRLAARTLRLRTLDVSWCSHLTDGGFAALLPRCRRLTSLDIAGCSKITDVTIRDLARHCSHLKSLSIEGCVQITADALRQLLPERGGALHELHISDTNFRLPGNPPVPDDVVQMTSTAEIFAELDRAAKTVASRRRAAALTGNDEIVLIKSQDRIYLNGHDRGVITPRAICILEKMMTNPRRRWRYNELLPSPKITYTPRQHQGYVRDIIRRSIPSAIRQLFEPNPGGRTGGWCFMAGVRVRIEK